MNADEFRVQTSVFSPHARVVIRALLSKPLDCGSHDLEVWEVLRGDEPGKELEVVIVVKEKEQNVLITGQPGVETNQEDVDAGGGGSFGCSD